MPRPTRKTKPLIYVFCEGESEQAYTEFLKKTFSDLTVIKYPKSTGLFEEAQNKFMKDKSYRDSAEVTDEIWFFFDVEKDQKDKWDAKFRIIKYLRKLRKKPEIRVRLLMTTACIEYWLMLHFKKYAPNLETVADKQRVLHEVQSKEKDYEKGDYATTARIVARYSEAVLNAKAVLKDLLQEELPELAESDARNKWLYTSSKTFSTVFEAIEYLESLKK